MLFWVTIRGRERTFSKPRDSAIVSRKSSRTLLLKLMNWSALVGPVAPRFENSGIVPGTVALWMYNGVSPETTLGVFPTAWSPPIAECPLPQPKPSCVPMSRAKLRVAATTRASISTSCVLRSSCVSRRSTAGITEGISSMMSAFVRDYVTPLGKEFLYGWHYVFRVRVAQEASDGDLINGQCFGFLLRALRFGFLAQSIDSSDAQHIPFELPRKTIVLQNDVEGLIPRYVIQDNG